MCTMHCFSVHVLSISHTNVLVVAGYSDTGAYWRSWYESTSFRADLEKLLVQLKPLYQQLHAYVRRKLMNTYGKDIFPSTGHIPAHLLGELRLW